MNEETAKSLYYCSYGFRLQTHSLSNHIRVRKCRFQLPTLVRDWTLDSCVKHPCKPSFSQLENIADLQPTLTLSEMSAPSSPSGWTAAVHFLTGSKTLQQLKHIQEGAARFVKRVQEREHITPIGLSFNRSSCVELPSQPFEDSTKSGSLKKNQKNPKKRFNLPL